MTKDVYLFIRKPTSLADIGIDDFNDAGDMEYASIVETKEMTTEEYDLFTANFFQPCPWLKGKGGYNKDGYRQAVAVTAAERETLYIDPSGYDYARYVGFLVDKMEDE